jgi:hypothetical protein
MYVYKYIILSRKYEEIALEIPEEINGNRLAFWSRM